MNCVYKITNSINGKAYIGITRQGPSRRWIEHVSRFKLGERDHKLYEAIRKHGLENFKMTVLCTACDSESLKQMEVYFISKFNTFKRGYNMTCGGDFVSEESIEKIRSKMIGRKVTWYNKILESRKSNPNRRSCSEWAKRGSDHSKSSRYLVRTPSGNELIIDGLRQFCRENGLDHKTLLDVLKKKQNHHKGYVLLSRFNDYPVTEYTQAGGNGAHPVTRAG